MSDSDLLARLGGDLARIPREYDRREEEVIDECPPSFGWLRGVRDSAPMLELRRKTGAIRAIGYSWIEAVEFDPSEGIFLDVGDQRIAIRGRNLNIEVRQGVRLFEGIARHRVPWIREVTGAEAMQAQPNLCVVETIEW